jgi:LPS export ABC transporter protein LptC
MSRTRRGIKLGLTIVILLIFGALTMVFVQLKRHQGQHSIEIPKSAGDALLTLAGFEKTAVRNGRKQWKLDAESAELMEGGGTVRLHIPKVDFFLEDGDRVALTATQGELDTDTNDITVQGAVHLSNDRYIMQTDSLVYHHDTKMLEARQPVSVTGQGMSLTADSMIYDITTNQARFSGHVKGNILSGFSL